MKILHIIPNLRKGGAERLTIDIVSELSKKENIDVRLIIFQNEVEYNVSKIKHLIVHIPTKVSLSVWKKNRFETEALQTFINEFSPDIIHTHLFEAEIAPRLNFRKSCKYFSHIHWNTKELKKVPFRNLFSKQGIIDFYTYRFLSLLYKKSNNKFLAISKHSEDFYAKNLPFLKDNIFLLPNAIDIERFSNTRARDISNLNPLKLISVGSLNMNKNQTFQIDIAKELKERNVNFVLYILGDGSIKEQLQEKINQYKLTENVFLLGNIENVEDYLKSSDIFIHTTLVEAFGLVIVEAMASGLPIVALDGGGNRDILIDNENCLLSQEQNIQIFADNIEKIVNSKELYSYISNHAKEFSSDFDIKIYISKLIAIYKNR